MVFWVRRGGLCGLFGEMVREVFKRFGRGFIFVCLVFSVRDFFCVLRKREGDSIGLVGVVL